MSAIKLKRQEVKALAAKKKVDLLDGDAEELIKGYLPLLERMLGNEQIIPRNNNEKEIMGKMNSMREKMVRIISAYGKEITIKLKYIPWFTRLLNNEQILPRNYAEYHALRKFSRVPDGYSESTDTLIYADVAMPDGRMIAWSRLSKRQQEAMADYILFKMAEAFGYIPAGKEAARRKKEVEAILQAA